MFPRIPSGRRLAVAVFLRLTALVPLVSLPPLAAQETVGGGTLDSPAVGPAPSFGLGGPDVVLVKNWDFGVGGTIPDMPAMNAEFVYHDQFGTINNGGNYGASIVAPDATNALAGQPVEGVDCPAVRAFTSDSLRTYLQPLDGATTVSPSAHNAGCGSFMARWTLPYGGSLLGCDVVWETRVRMVTPPYFWFALWTSGNIWDLGAEHDLVESFGYDNGGGYTNYDGRYWHSNAVSGSDAVNYNNSWAAGMADAGITSFDATQYHIWTWVYRADNTYSMYADGIEVQHGVRPYSWTVGARAGGTPVDVNFLFDAGWGHTQIASVNLPLPASSFDGTYYEWDYSRVYLVPPTTVPPAPTGVSARPDNGEVTLSWNLTPGAESYSVYRGTSPGGEDATPVQSGLVSLTWTDTGLTNGMTYYYTVVGVNRVGPSAPSAEVSTRPLVTYIVDDADAAYVGTWTVSTSTPGYYGTGYRHDGSTGATGGRSATFTPVLPRTGNYEIFLRAPASTNRASNVPVDIVYAAGTTTVRVNEQLNSNRWVSLGQYVCDAGTSDRAVIRNDGANGYVIADALEWMPVAPPTPAGVSAAAGDGQVGLQWSASIPTATYRIKRAVTSGGPYAEIGTTTATGYVDGSVVNGTAYYYVVSAFDDVGESADSAEASATPAADAVPPAPTGLAAAGGDTQVALQWSAAAGAGSYRVKRATVAGGPYATVATVTDTSFVDASVVNETGYTYVVSAVSLIGESADSAEVAVTPHQGTVIVDDAQPDCVFTGVWTVSQGSPGYYGTGYHHDGNTGAAGGKRAAFTPQLFTAGNYEVLVRAPSDANRAANIPVDIVHAGGTTTRTLNEQYNNNTWVSLGRYVCDAGSTPSVTLRNDGTNGYVVADAVKWTLVAPAAPADVTAIPGNAEVALAWSPSVGANVYTVKRATVSGGPYTALGTITGSTFTDDTAANGTTYFYIVTASDLLRGEGAASAEVAATPPYGSAIIDDADGAPACTFTGAWPVSQGSPGYYGTGYHHDGNTGATGGLRATYTPDLVADATYEVFLRAPSDPNRASNIPVDIVHADGTTTVTVNEQLHNNTWVSLGSYVFHAGSGGSVTLRNDGANGYVVADAVRWIPTTPLAPAALAASADTNRVALTWSASRFATGYVVRRGTAAGGPFATIATTVDGTSFDDAAVAAGVTYYYVVAAANDLGIGAASPPAAATLLVPPSVAITPAVADATAGGSVTFSAAAAGTAPLTYQWRKAGVALAEATAPTLTLDPLSTADAGSYDVVVTNPVGTAVSGPATLDVSKAEAAITLDGLFQTYDGGTHPVTADTTPAGLTVSLTYDGSAEPPVTAGLYPVVATVADPDFTGTGAGTLIIAKATAAVALAPLTQAYDGTPRSVTATTSPAGLPVDLLYDGGVAAPVYPGAHTVTATVADPNYAGTATATLTLTTTALVRHAPTLDGTVHGSVQVAEPESVSLNGSTTVSGDLLLSGLPTIRLNGQPLLAGVRDAAGAPSPGTHVVTLNGGAVLRYVVRRVDAPSWPVVGAPPAPTGIRDVTLGRPGDPTGDFATIRSLTLDGQAGRVAVPSGTYGTLTANGGSTLALGTAGASTPDVYWLQGLVLNGGARLEIDGPVLLVLAQSVVLNGLAGDAAHPDWLRLEIAAGGLTLDGGATLHGEVVAPAGQVVLNGGSAIHGRIVADRFLLNGGGLLEEP